MADDVLLFLLRNYSLTLLLEPLQTEPGPQNILCDNRSRLVQAGHPSRHLADAVTAHKQT